jgi:hypothetical protein
MGGEAAMTKKEEPRKEIPKTQEEWARYRCQLNCQIGRNALDKREERAGELAPPLEYAMFCLLNAVEELSRIGEKG